MIMITSKCFILLLLPSPVSCVWIDHSYQSVTRPLSSSSWSDAVILLWWWSWWRLGWEWFAIMILCLTSSELKISVLDTKVSLSPVLPYFLVSPPNTPNAIPPSPMSRCHVVTMSPPHSHITSFSFFPLTLCLSSLWLMGFVLRNHFVVSISSKGLSLLLPMSIVFWTNDWAPSRMNLKQAEFTKKTGVESQS